MAQRTENNPPFGWREWGKVIDDITELYDSVGTYKVYRALLSQTTTGNPIPTVLDNTLGSVTFSRSAAGEYSADSSSLFTSNKTVVNFNMNFQYVNDETDNYKRIDSTSSIFLLVKDSGGTEIDGWTGEIEIKVYD